MNNKALNYYLKIEELITFVFSNFVSISSNFDVFNVLIESDKTGFSSISEYRCFDEVNILSVILISNSTEIESGF